MRLRQTLAGGERWGASHQITDPTAVEVDQMSIGVLTSQTPLTGLGRLTHRGEVAGRHVYTNPTALPRYRATGCAVAVTSESRNRVDLRLNCQRPSVLETSEAHFGAWRALLDQQPAPIEILYGAFRSIPVGPGNHQAVFYYSPNSLYKYLAGLLIWLATWLYPLTSPTAASTANFAPLSPADAPAPLSHAPPADTPRFPPARPGPAMPDKSAP